MQKIAAYLLERRVGVGTAEHRALEVERLIKVLQDFLKAKGADQPKADSGTFKPEAGTATFRWERAKYGARSWRLLRLDEEASNGRRFTTSASITDTGSIVAVYISLEAGGAFSRIGPIVIDPKCPRFVRDLLDLSGDWYHGEKTKLQRRAQLTGKESGEWLAGEIKAKERTIPMVVLSEDGGALVLPGLDELLARDLAGIANIFVVDKDASWGLTEALGKAWSVYWGAVRVYWPMSGSEDNPFDHPLWTAQNIVSGGVEVAALIYRFRRHLRLMVMQVSALSVLRPREIDGIRNSAARQELVELQSKASSLAEYRELAETYANDNSRLTAENERLQDEHSQLATRLENAC